MSGMGVIASIAVLALPVAFMAGWWFRGRGGGEASGEVMETVTTEPLPALPEMPTRFLVVQRSNRGARAREMFERGTPGEGETLEFWDGNVCRGRKGPVQRKEPA